MEGFEGITDLGEEALVRGYKVQIIAIGYVGLWANPFDLSPEVSSEVLHLRQVQSEAIVHKYAQMALLLWQFKDILSKVAEISGTVENVPFVPACPRQGLDIQNSRAVCNVPPSLPAGRGFLRSRFERAAINRCDCNLFSDHDLAADTQKVKLFVGDQPLVSSMRSEREHHVDCT